MKIETYIIYYSVLIAIGSTSNPLAICSKNIRYTLTNIRTYAEDKYYRYVVRL